MQSKLEQILNNFTKSLPIQNASISAATEV